MGAGSYNSGNKLTYTLFLFLLVFILCSSLVSAESFSFDYDDNGNMIEAQYFSYEYNEFNQLVAVYDLESNLIEEYSYDHEGNRIKKIEYSYDETNITTYYPFPELIESVNDTEIEDTYYYFLDGKIISRDDPDGDRYYYHNDHLGSHTLVTDETGNVAEETVYKPFGGVWSGGEADLLFTGKELDDGTNLYYYSARYYDSELRQFTQPDTIIPKYYDPQSLNRFSYVENNPYKYTDPTGHYVETAVDVISLGVSISDLRHNSKSVMNWVALGADLASIALPFVTSGGLIVKGVSKSGKVGDVIHAAKNFELFKIKDLHFTHPNDDIFDILRNKGNTKISDPIKIWGIKDKLIVTDGVGRTTRRIAAGYDTVPGELLYNIPDTSKLAKQEQKTLNRWYDNSVPADIGKTEKRIKEYKAAKKGGRKDVK